MKNIPNLSLLFVLLTGLISFAPPEKAAAAPAAQVPGNVIEVNDNNQAVIYTGAEWEYLSGVAGYYANDVHWSTTAGNYLKITFIGTYVQVIVHTGTQGGLADVYIDDVFDEEIDTYSEQPASQVEIYTADDLTSAVHTIKVVVQGDHNVLSTNDYVSIDAFRYSFADVTWTCIANPGGCPVPNDPMAPYLSVGTKMKTGINQGTEYWQARLNCLGRMQCVNDYAIYYRVQFTIDWAWNWGIAQGKTTTVSADVITKARVGPNHANHYDCGTGASGQCSGTIYGVIPANEMNTTSGSFDIETSIGMYGQRDNVSIEYAVYYSLLPYASDCALDYQLLTTDGPYVIDPTIEHPLGPTGSPSDEQVYVTTPGIIYAITSDGGPWKDGTNDRYDAALSWDDLNYTAFKDVNALCVQVDPVNPELRTLYVHAESATLYVRANDNDLLTGGFANNSSYMGQDFTYTVSPAVLIAATDCASQFTYDPVMDLVSEPVVEANTSETEALSASSTLAVVGDWYVVEVASGEWFDNSAGPNIDMEFEFRASTPFPGTDFADLAEGSPGVWCAQDNKFYVQASTTVLMLRVNDATESWSDNTGAMNVNIYHASFTRRPETCELQFGWSDMLYSGLIDAHKENGKVLGSSAVAGTITPTGLGNVSSTTGTLNGNIVLVPGAWYMLQTSGGPWGWVGTSWEQSFELAIKDSAINTWGPLKDWPGAACNVPIDALGHRMVFFQVPDTAVEYSLRVDDSSMWLYNNGAMGYSLYKAYDKGVSLPNGTCDYDYDVDHPAGGIYLDANLSTGVLLGSLAPNTLYAIQIKGDPTRSDYNGWKESSGGDVRYDVQISDNNGATWHELPANYGGVLCYTQNGNTTTLFLQTGAHYIYKFRVNSMTFSDNEDGLRINYFAANPGDTVNPWVTCIDGLTKYIIVSHEWIDVKAKEGEDLLFGYGASYTGDPNVQGFVVEIEYGTGPWHPNDGSVPNGSYEAALSADNGSTWNPLDRTSNSDIVCSGQDHLKLYKWAYFKVEDGQKWKIRVNDGDDADFTNNTGNLGYKLWAITETNVTPDCLVDTNRTDCLPPDVAIAVQGPNGMQDICSLGLVMPTDFLDVPAWITYGFDTMLQFMAWCPRHTDLLMGLFNLFKNREPFATLLEMQSIVKKAQGELASYNWNDTQAEPSGLGGTSEEGSSNNIIDRLFPSSGPWNGGPLITMQSWGPTTYFNSCTASYYSMLGSDFLTTGICFVSAAAREVGASFVLQVIIDLAFVFYLIRHIWFSAKWIAGFMSDSAQTTE